MMRRGLRFRDTKGSKFFGGLSFRDTRGLSFCGVWVFVIRGGLRFRDTRGTEFLWGLSFRDTRGSEFSWYERVWVFRGSEFSWYERVWVFGVWGLSFRGLSFRLTHQLCVYSHLRSWDCAVVTALVSHQCWTYSNPGVDAICGPSGVCCWFSSLLAQRVFARFSGLPPSPLEPPFLNSNSIGNVYSGWRGTSLLCSFKFPLCYIFE